jgi:hypothetical protein
MLCAFPLKPMPLPTSVLPIALSLIATMVLGMVWFSPLLFAKQWMRLTKTSAQAVKNGAGPEAYLVSILMNLLIAIVLCTVFSVMKVTDVKPAISLAFLFWAAFGAVPMLNHAMYDRTPRALVAIYAGYDLCNALIVALILVAFR